jgi:hypothetical protein
VRISLRILSAAASYNCYRRLQKKNGREYHDELLELFTITSLAGTLQYGVILQEKLL